MKTKIKIGVYSWNERELSQIIRRKMITKGCKNKKKFDRNSDKRGFKKETSLYFLVKKIEIFSNSSILFM